MGAAQSLGRHWLGTWFEAKQACGVGEMAHRYALVARTAKGNTAEPQQVGTWRMDGRARTHRRGFLLSNPLQTKMGMGTWLEACRVGEMASRQGSQCFTLPLRLPLSQSRGVGGYTTSPPIYSIYYYRSRTYPNPLEASFFLGALWRPRPTVRRVVVKRKADSWSWGRAGQPCLRMDKQDFLRSS